MAVEHAHVFKLGRTCCDTIKMMGCVIDSSHSFHSMNMRYNRVIKSYAVLNVKLRIDDVRRGLCGFVVGLIENVIITC